MSDEKTNYFSFLFQEFDEGELEAELYALVEEPELEEKKEHDDPDMIVLAAWGLLM